MLFSLNELKLHSTNIENNHCQKKKDEVNKKRKRLILHFYKALSGTAVTYLKSKILVMGLFSLVSIFSEK